ARRRAFLAGASEPRRPDHRTVPDLQRASKRRPDRRDWLDRNAGIDDIVWGDCLAGGERSGLVRKACGFGKVSANDPCRTSSFIQIAGLLAPALIVGDDVDA